MKLSIFFFIPKVTNAASTLAWCLLLFYIKLSLIYILYIFDKVLYILNLPKLCRCGSILYLCCQTVFFDFVLVCKTFLSCFFCNVFFLIKRVSNLQFTFLDWCFLSYMIYFKALYSTILDWYLAFYIEYSIVYSFPAFLSFSVPWSPLGTTVLSYLLYLKGFFFINFVNFRVKYSKELFIPLL